MFKKIRKFVFKRKIISFIILIGLVYGGYFSYQKITNSDGQTRYVLANVEKGTIIDSVSTVGQVAALDRADIKSTTSGKVIQLLVSQDQVVKANQLLAVVDATSAKRAVSGAQIDLENAQIKLDDLLAEPTEDELLQAQSDLSQAQNDLAKAETANQNIQADIADDLKQVYNTGYSKASSGFSSLAGIMQDLADVLGTSKNSQANVSSYEIVLGKNSPFISKLLEDYDIAIGLYNDSFAFFRTVSQDDQPEVMYDLLHRIQKASKAISQASESARHMYDAMAVNGYSQYAIASAIDKMRPKIESDFSAAFSLADSLETVIENIDTTNQEIPERITSAKLTLQSTKAKLLQKEKALADLKAGASDLDIRSQQNLVDQKRQALEDAQEQLTNCSVRAPFAGQVAEVDVKQGDELANNTLIAVLITNQKVAEITLNEIDIAKIKLGQKATISFDALADFSTTGRVSQIDTLGSVSQGVVNYNIQIAFDLDDERVKPGMSLSADIITNLKQDVLMIPNSAIKQANSLSYVQLPSQAEQNLSTASVASITGRGFLLSQPIEQQPIEVGLSNDTYSEVVSGLSEGQQIIVQTITSNSTNSQSQTQSSSSLRIPGLTGGGGGGAAAGAGASGSFRMNR